MKKNIFTSLFLIFCFGLFAQNEKKIVLEGEVLNGRVKIIYEKRIYTNDTDSFTYVFNESGLLISKESPLFMGLNKKVIYAYNSDNQVIRATMYDEAGTQTNYTEFTYENGDLIKRFIKHAKSTPKITRYFDYEIDNYKYDKNRNLIEKTELIKRKNSSREILREHVKYQYDSIGNCIIEEELCSKGKVVERKVNKYVNSKLIETFTWLLFEGENLNLKDTYEYNEDGTIKSHTNIIYMYDSTEEIDAIWTENYSYKYEYDDNGRLIGESVTTLRDNKQEETTWKLVDFDTCGNWTQKTIRKAMIIREIEYY